MNSVHYFNFIESVVDHISDFYILWLFYIGAIILSLHYFVQFKWVKSIFFLGLALIWLKFMLPFFQYLEGLGTDSFQEVQDFDLKEAYFWLSTFFNIFKNSALSLKALSLYSLIAAILFGFIKILNYLNFSKLKKNSVLCSWIGILLIVTGLFLNTYKSVKIFIESSNSFNQLTSNFSNDVEVNNVQTNINVFLYIGESTSSMNMGIYNYPRQTTPQLKRLENETGLIKFNNVFSTHSHTSPSLLEALSLGLDFSENFKPIHERQRISIVDVLNKAKIPTQLFSNQGSTGSYNQASSVIFKNANKKFSQPSNRRLGNNNSIVGRPWDHDFFNSVVDINTLNKSNISLKVFHSYAGHGPYIKNIPLAFRNPIDEYFQQFEPKAITGSIQAINEIEHYDSAIKYIDFSISNGIELINKSSSPWVFIYFSDHGESVFSNRGHDSSRFIHEMARVPLIMFFNPAAREVAPSLFKKYKKLADTNNLTTLSQLPSTILDLFNVSTKLDTLPIIGTSYKPFPIMIRETIDGISGVKLSDLKVKDLIDKSDIATTHFINRKANINHHPLICYHRSNTIAKALRGSITSDCLEIDIVVNEDDRVLVFHPPEENNTNLTLNKILYSVSGTKNLSFWLDGKNLISEKNCYSLASDLKSSRFNKSQILIEFPTSLNYQISKLESCIKNLRNFDFVQTSYNVSTADVLNCSNMLIKGNKFNIVDTCQNLKKDLLEVERSGLFSDISFDFNGFKAIEFLDLSSKFELNAWNVKLSDLNLINSDEFRMIILNNDDPNNI